MGLNDNTRRINVALTEANRLKQEKEAERRRKEQEKENQKRLEKDIKKELETEFYKYFELYGSSYITEFYNIERKENIFKCILEEHGEPITTYFINKRTGKTEKEVKNYKNKENVKEIFNRYYYKILKDQYNIFKNNEKYLKYKENQEAETIPKERNFNIWNILEKAINVIIKIICFLILGIITLIAAAVKSVK